jgi:RNA polymerase sigma factor (sigma-70 family)
MAISEQMFRRHFPEWHQKIYRYVACRLPAADVCGDVVGEVFVEAWRRREGYVEDRGEIMAWLTGIARHKMADYWRTRQPEMWDEAVLDRLVDVSVPSLEYQTDVQTLFSKVMADLPTETKALLMFRHKDGLTYEEIAEIVGKSPAAVRQLFSRLHRTLRLQFPQYEFPSE